MLKVVSGLVVCQILGLIGAIGTLITRERGFYWAAVVVWIHFLDFARASFF
jgi:hypothetical protein